MLSEFSDNKMSENINFYFEHGAVYFQGWELILQFHDKLLLCKPDLRISLLHMIKC